jgi:hypothetical protein
MAGQPFLAYFNLATQSHPITPGFPLIDALSKMSQQRWSSLQDLTQNVNVPQVHQHSSLQRILPPRSVELLVPSTAKVSASHQPRGTPAGEITCSLSIFLVVGTFQTFLPSQITYPRSPTASHCDIPPAYACYSPLGQRNYSTSSFSQQKEKYKKPTRVPSRGPT